MTITSRKGIFEVINFRIISKFINFNFLELIYFQYILRLRSSWLSRQSGIFRIYFNEGLIFIELSLLDVVLVVTFSFRSFQNFTKLVRSAESGAGAHVKTWDKNSWKKLREFGIYFKIIRKAFDVRLLSVWNYGYDSEILLKTLGGGRAPGAQRGAKISAEPKKFWNGEKFDFCEKSSVTTEIERKF